ncbi:hypothetical protein M0804_009218 [Polistes exclamans]|nr:hypothetical protein M0804_009218 [Polistes exclamans]
MDSAPALETVYQAVYSLYNNSNPSDSSKASSWLEELQKSVYAWKIADEMLQQKRDIESCYFAAQTMRTKIQQSFHELPAEAHTSLRDSLLDHISQINENTNTAIVTQLCLAMAALTIQMVSWHKPVVDLINRYGGRSSSLWPLLEILTVLPEEVKSRSLRLGTSRRDQVMVELKATADTVAEFLKMCLKDGSDNVLVRVTIFRCFTSWITAGAIPLRVIPTSDIVAYVFQVLGDHTAGSLLHESAADCLCVILQALQDDDTINRDNNCDLSAQQYQQLQMCLFTNVMDLEQPYHLSVVHEDMEKSINYCRIFTELAETFIDTIIEGSMDGKQHYAIQILDLVLMCLGHHDFEVAQITFHLWYRLSEAIYQRNSEDLNIVFRPQFQRLIAALCRHCQMEPDHLGLVEEGGGGEEFADFRKRASELVKDVVFVVGSSNCFRQMFTSLTGGPGPQGLPVPAPTWDTVEAALFIMQAVAKNILPEESDIVPKVVEAILNLPENTHIAVRHISIVLLGELCEWINDHPPSLEPILNTLLTCLNQKGLGNAAANALLSICTVCSDRMAPHFNVLLQIARSLDNFNLSVEGSINLLKGVSWILAILPKAEIEPAMKELCWFQAMPLCQLMQSKVPVEKGTKTDPAIWLDRLSVIFRYTNPHIEDENAPHPCRMVIIEMWPVLSNVCTQYQHDPRLMERVCRCLRFAVRCVGKQLAHLLKPLVEQIVQLYATHQHSSFLYLGSILVDEYATDIDCVSGLLNMLEALVGPTFTILQEEDGLKNHPDTVDDLFRLCDRFLQRAPVPFLHSSIIGSVIDCALMACSLDHRDANASVMKFFYDLIHSACCFEKNSDFTIRQQLVRDILAEKGQTLVMRLLHSSVFSLPAYMASDVADVLLKINLTDRQLFSKWLEEAIKSMPLQNTDGSPTATNEELVQLHNTIISAEKTSKPVATALKMFARYYR